MASKLILKFKDAVITENILDQEETTIGRKPENTIHVDNLAVSGKHARVLKIGNKCILEDLGSTNGTIVNGKLITKHVLTNGDTIVIGKHTLVYVELDDMQSSKQMMASDIEDSMDKTMILGPQARNDMMPPQKKMEKSATQMPLGSIQIIQGPQMGKEFELSSSLTSLGKGDSCKIKVKGFTVGKQAAVITRRPTGYHITHLEGMAKTKVNGDTLGDEPRTLNDGDTIEIGDTKMEFFIKKPA